MSDEDQETRDRVIRLEGRMDAMRDSMTTFMAASSSDRAELHKVVTEIDKKLERIHTFGGAIAFLVTGIWALLSFAKDWFAAR
jgi:uncharacterized protein with PhoU and TrkA domain